MRAGVCGRPPIHRGQYVSSTQHHSLALGARLPTVMPPVFKHKLILGLKTMSVAKINLHLDTRAAARKMAM